MTVDQMKPRRRALVTGITGQDGSYLAEFLLRKDYEVHGLVRRSSTFSTDRIDHLYLDPHEQNSRLFLHYGDMSDTSGIRHTLDEVRPDEIYNLAAQSHVKVSFGQPEYTADIVSTGCLRLVDAFHDYVRSTGIKARFYQACSSEMFGSIAPPQRETTQFHPRSPYAVAKVAAYWFCVNYREAYDLHISNGILFNHESPRRGETFVTRKITRAVARIAEGLQDKLFLGNLDSRRDWGYAGDYVEAMWLMLQQDKPDDYVIASGESHSVREFLEAAFGQLNMDYQDYVVVDPRYYRPAEVDHLEGDFSKAREAFGWEPRVGFAELVSMMVDHDLALARQERILRNAGHMMTLRGAAIA